MLRTRSRLFQRIVNLKLHGWDSQRTIYSPFVAMVLTSLSGKVCDHEGPCHKPTRGECHCYMRRVHCSRNCPCAKSCKSCSWVASLCSSFIDRWDSGFLRWCVRQCQTTTVLITHRKGCSCVWKRTGPKNPPCQVGKDGKRSKCECRAAFRECDPEVCGKCHARYVIAFGFPRLF